MSNFLKKTQTNTSNINMEIAKHYASKLKPEEIKELGGVMGETMRTHIVKPVENQTALKLKEKKGFLNFLKSFFKTNKKVVAEEKDSMQEAKHYVRSLTTEEIRELGGVMSQTMKAHRVKPIENQITLNLEMGA